MTMKHLAAVSAALMLAAAAIAPANAQGRPGQKQYTMISQHNPGALMTAIATGQDLLKSGTVREFRIYLSGRAVLMVLPGTTSIQKDYMKTVPRTRGLTVIACKEITDQLAKRNQGRQPPLLSGTRKEACAGASRKLETAGWYRVPGL